MGKGKKGKERKGKLLIFNSARKAVKQCKKQHLKNVYSVGNLFLVTMNK